MKRHPVEVLSLGTGLSFLMYALAYIIGTAIGSPPNGLIALPLLIIALCASVVAALVVAQQRSEVATSAEQPG